VQGEPGLGQHSGDVPRHRVQRITGGQWVAVAIGEPGSRVRQFLRVGERPKRAQVRRLVSLGGVVGEAAPHLRQTVL
jgi:hypothetical protein